MRVNFRLMLAFLVVLINISFIQAQQPHKLILEVENYPKEQWLWVSLYGDDYHVIDTIDAFNGTAWIYEIPFGTPHGIYRVVEPDGEKQIELVYDGEDIRVSTDYEKLFENLEFIESASSRKYHRYMRAKSYIRFKQKSLEDFLAEFPADDPFYQHAARKYMNLADEHNDSLNQLLENTSGFMRVLLENEKAVDAPAAETLDSYREARKARYFNNKDYSKSSVLRSRFFPDQLLEYLGYYREKHFNQKQQEQAFMVAVDTIFNHTKVNPEVFDFSVNFLLEGFERFGFDALVQHIAKRTEAELDCINEERREAMQEKISGISAVAEGEKAPPLKMPNRKGNMVSLDDVESEYILLVFWASWCPHCMDMLPDLEAFNRQFSDSVEVVTVSIDNEEEAWKAAAQEVTAVHLSTLQGWETPAVDDYRVYGTPSYFLLDKNRIILTKSAVLGEIQSYLKKNPPDNQ
ncbi:MAG: TlpA family protein disulfide reductase [Bacteroidota bacterium]